MEAKQSQKDFVKAELIKNGFISRNKCLKNYISRLSAYILILKKEGFVFAAKRVESTTKYGTTYDFIYYWTNREMEDLKTEYYFDYFDDTGAKETVKIAAKSFDAACSIFLMQPPIFMTEISNEVSTKVGSIFLLEIRKEFNQFKIKK